VSFSNTAVLTKFRPAEFGPNLRKVSITPRSPLALRDPQDVQQALRDALPAVEPCRSAHAL
jgi:hypothetical protein